MDGVFRVWVQERVLPGPEAQTVGPPFLWFNGTLQIGLGINQGMGEEKGVEYERKMKIEESSWGFVGKSFKDLIPLDLASDSHKHDVVDTQRSQSQTIWPRCIAHNIQHSV